MGMLPPVVARLITDAKGAAAEWKAYGSEMQQTLTKAAAVAEAKATEMENAAKRAALEAERAAERASIATGKAAEKANLAAKHAQEDAVQAEEAAKIARADASKAAAELEANTGKSSAALGGLKAASDKALLGVAATAGIVGFESLKMAGNFQQSTTLLETGAGETAANVKIIGKGMLDMAGATGTSAQTLSDAMYQVESAIGAIAPKGHTAADSLNILRAAAQGAKTDGADTVEVAKALTTVMADLKIPTKDAATTMSQMVTAVGAGKMKMNDLASAIPEVLPKAAALGIGFAQVGGALATMTAQGMSAQQSAENLANVISSLAKPTLVMTKTMAAYGISSLDVSKNLGKRGLTGTLDLLYGAVMRQSKGGVAMQNAFMANKVAAEGLVTMYAKLPPQVQKLADSYTKGAITGKQFSTALHGMSQDDQVLGAQFKKASDNAAGFSQALRSGKGDLQTMTGALSDMTGGMTGLQVVTHLTGENASVFADNVKKIAGTTADANGSVKDFDKSMATWNNTLASAKASLGATGIEIGQELIPPLTAALKFFQQHTTTLKVLVGVIGGVAGALAAYSLAVKIHTAYVGTAKAITMVYDATLKRLGMTTAEVATEQQLLGGRVQGASGRMSGATAAMGRLTVGLIAAQTASAAFGHSASGSMTEATKALQDYAKSGATTGDVTKHLEYDLNSLADTTWSDKLSNGTAKAVESMTGLGSVFDESIQHASERLGSLDAAMAQLVQSGHADQAKQAYQRLTDEAKKQNITLDDLKKAFPQYEDALAGIAPKADAAATAQEKLNSALDSSTNGLLMAHQAESSYYAALDQVTAALKENGKGLDVHTEKGRANRDALDGLVKASLDRLQALKDSNAPSAEFNKALDAERAALVNAAKQAGASKQQIQQYSAAISAVPKEADTTVKVDTSDALARIQFLKAAISSIPGSGTQRALQKAAQLGHSDGGLIPGGPSDEDTVPAMLAEGEFVVNANATAKNLPLLEAINDGSVAHYASGGQVQHLASGGRASSRSAKKPKLSAEAKQAAAELKSAFASVNAWIPAGIAQAVERGRASAIKEVQTLGAQMAKTHQQFAYNLVKTSGNTLIKLGTSYDAIGVKLKAAQANLKQLQEDSAKLAADTASKIVGTGDISAVTGAADASGNSTQATATDMIANLHKSITTAQQFGQALAELKKQGLDSTSLSQLAAAGPAAGLATANALLQGGKAAITQVAQLQAQLAATATASGKQVADSMYASGIAAAQGLMKGLQSQENAILAQINKMVLQMVTAVKKNLKIHSPSQVTEEEIGSPMGAGVPIGFTKAITKGMPDVHAALGGIVGARSFSVGGIPASGMGSSFGGGGGVIQLEVHSHTHLDGKELRVTTQRETVRYNGRNANNGMSLARGR